MIIDPKDLNIKSENFNNIVGRDAKYNSEQIINIFKGEDNDFSKAVSLNAAAGLIVSEKETNFQDAYEKARSHLQSGETFKFLEKLQNAR